jgi:CubicO group peptidase (beta-lactamase class C family)
MSICRTYTPAIRGLALALLLVSFCFHALADTESAARYSARHGERALLVWQNGRLRLERYGADGSRDKSENIFSITKSLCALGTFAAIGRKQLHLDEAASLTLSEWRNEPLKRKITVRDLLNQTSGLRPGFEELYAPNLYNKEKTALKLPAVAAPGKEFAYGPSHYEVLETLMARKLRESPLVWMDVALFGPLGIKPGAWRRDRLGSPYFSAGAHVSARGLLAAGHLVRRKGWHWIFPLVPSSLIRTASAGSSANPIYGLGFWLNRLATERNVMECDVEEAIASGRTDWSRLCLSRSAPSDLIAMVGSRGQRVYVSSSRRLIIVRLGNGTRFRDPDFLRRFFE